MPCNVPVEPLGIVSQVFALGRVKSANEPIAMIVESEMAGGSDDERNGGNSGVDGTTSSGNVDSMRVKTMQLAAGSQHMCQSHRMQDRDLPVSSGPPIYPPENPYWTTGRQQQCARIKIKVRNVNQV